ncbi:MAG: amidohydrolase family protein [Anaerolineae bacterium]
MNQTIKTSALSGWSLVNYQVIDAHAHLGIWPTIHAAYGDAEGLLASMDRIGIETACLSTFQALGGDYRRGNDLAAEVQARYPGRFLGYGVINPNYQDDIEREVARCLDDLDLLGIKLHPTSHACPPDGPAYQRVYAMMQVRRGLVLSHTYGDPSTLERIAAGYPDVTFILAHAAATYEPEMAESLAVVMEARPNVYLDTCLSRVYYGDLERWVAAAGADRLLFGSDVPFNDNAHQIGRVTHADISEEDKRAILGGNMAALIASVREDAF